MGYSAHEKGGNQEDLYDGRTEHILMWVRMESCIHVRVNKAQENAYGQLPSYSRQLLACI